jgi:membrane fusion protein (multidrug efflux system)
LAHTHAARRRLRSALFDELIHGTAIHFPQITTMSLRTQESPLIASRANTRYGRVASTVLLLSVLGTAASLAAWKHASNEDRQAAAAKQPELAETVTVVTARERNHRRTITSIGTVLALRSVTLRNELAGTVREVSLTPGEIVEAGSLLVALDVSVEDAELKALEAQAALAKANLERTQRLVRDRAAPTVDVERALAEHDVAFAQIERAKAVIQRKTIRAPFRARVGLADIHPGQFLEVGTVLTTLQGVDDGVHVDFTVAQQVGAELRAGDSVEILTRSDGTPISARVVAVDARVDPATRNASVRARINDVVNSPAPGASVRVRVSTGPSQSAVVIPANALRRGPAGDRVFVVANDPDGRPRAHARVVQSGAISGDEVLVLSGLAAGERVAAAGSFKLRESALVTIANPPVTTVANLR